MDEQLYRLAKLVAYASQNKEKGTGDDLHAKLLDDIVANAHELGIERPFLHFKEVALCGGDTDILFVDARERIFLVEGKVIRNERKLPYGRIKLIKEQLLRHHFFFWDRYGLSAQLIGAYRYKGKRKITCYFLRQPDYVQSEIR